MTYDGNLEAEAAIVKIALCGKYQQIYSTLEEAGERAGLFPDQIEEIKQWKYHGIGQPLGNIDTLFDYFKYYERERYDKAVYLYTKDRYS